MIPRQYKLLLILPTLFCSILLNAQNPINHNIIGNKLSDDIYLELIDNNSTQSLTQLEIDIRAKLNSLGYYNSSIIKISKDSLANTSKNVFTLEINEGTQTFIRQIILENLNSYDSTNYLSKFNYLEGQVLIETNLENEIRTTLNGLENSGFPFAKIKINSIIFETDLDSNFVADVYLSFTKEVIRKIDKVEISGNTKTNDDVIINATRLTKGELYSQERIDEIPILLNKLRFFDNISKPKYLVNSDDEGILQISIKEKNTNSFDGILGYIPSSNDDESSYLTGFVNIALRNLFGTGRGLGLKWKQENSSTQELELKYLEPWIFNQPFNLNFQYFQRQQDSSYVKRIIGGSLEFLATKNISASVLLESEKIIPSLNINQSVLNSSSFNSGIQFRLDYRDDIYAPTSGTYFSSLYKYRSKTIDDINLDDELIESSKLNYHNYELDFGIFYSVFLNQVIALGVHAKEIIGDYFDPSDFFQLGGTNTLRGYRENQFLGNRIIWSNLEYRFMLSQTTYVFAFYDAGYYLINESKVNNINRQSALNNGYGFGISLETGLGIMKVSYAFAEGSSITNGLIHFGLLNEF